MFREFYIPFVGLKQGKHQYHYQIDNSLFENFNYKEFNSVCVMLTVVLEKGSKTLTLNFEGKGTVNVFCDLSNEPYDEPIDTTLNLIVKYGEQYNDEDDEILIIPHGEYQINIAQYIYEMIVLAMPAKKVHPGIKDGTLASDILDRLEELHPKARKKSKTTDPRWDTLKKLLTDK